MHTHSCSEPSEAFEQPQSLHYADALCLLCLIHTFYACSHPLERSPLESRCSLSRPERNLPLQVRQEIVMGINDTIADTRHWITEHKLKAIGMTHLPVLLASK